MPPVIVVWHAIRMQKKKVSTILSLVTKYLPSSMLMFRKRHCISHFKRSFREIPELSARSSIPLVLNTKGPFTYKHFICQTSSKSSISNSFRLLSTQDVENKFAICLSVAIQFYIHLHVRPFNALAESNLCRTDIVGIFPYASHCVLDTISRIATPNKLSALNRENVVYHQWGYVYNNPSISPNIEDAVDSLLTYGRHLFPTGGNFEIWSLPKIFSTSVVEFMVSL